MSLTKEIVAGSQVLTATMWNRQSNNIGSEFWTSYGFQNGSDYYVYDVSGNLISGNHYSVTGSYYEWWDYSGTNQLVSGHVLRDGINLTYAYYFDANNRLSGTRYVVS